MSADASGHVFRYAPFKGNTLLVLLAIADSVSDMHENECWMKMPKLADKARCHRDTVRVALLELVEAGWLEVVHQSAGKHGSRYRFVFDETRHEVFQARTVRPQAVDNPVSKLADSPRVTDGGARKDRREPADSSAPTRGESAGLNNPKDPNRSQAPVGSRSAELAAARATGEACTECNGSKVVVRETNGALIAYECHACSDA